MSKVFRRIKHFFTDPWHYIYYIVRSTSRIWPTKPYLQLIFRSQMGKWINFKNPKTYNEKLNWLKLYDHNPRYTMLVDKYSVKKYVANIIGEQYIIPTLGVWNNPEDIDWDKLPNQFVLKVTHDSGGLVICKDKSKIDIVAAKEKLLRGLKRDYYHLWREWPYKNVPKRIIAEQYMEDDKTKELRDYKFFCMNGVVRSLFIATDRQNRPEPYFDFFDTSFRHLPIQQGHPNAPVPPTQPENFELMKHLAAKLSEGLPESRVDFYEVNGKVYFGEITLFHFGGIVPFNPKVVDEEWGKWIILPIEENKANG